MSLPLLEAMLPGNARAMGSSPRLGPTRAVWIYAPNGVHMPDWTPEREGRLRSLPWILEPLDGHRDRLTVLSGLAHDKARANGDGPGDHARASAAFLTGVQPLKTDGQVLLGPSADQIAAAAIGDRTRFRSLALGCEGARNSGQCDSGYACAYSHNISWLSETTPAGKDTNPRLVFDRLFRGLGEGGHAAARRDADGARRRSVLDYVRADAARLERKLGSADRRKLDEYFSGVRELERRIELALEQQGPEVPESARPLGQPDGYLEHARLLIDLLVLAFSTDSTRIATLMLANEGSNRSYHAIGISEGHHELSHHGNAPDKIEKIRRINRLHVELLAYFLDQLKSARDVSGSLIDSCMLAYGSSISDGNRHQHHELPFLLCGGGNGSLRGGRHIRYPDETPANNLHMALLERMDFSPPGIGDATGAIAGL